MSHAAVVSQAPASQASSASASTDVDQEQSGQDAAAEDPEITSNEASDVDRVEDPGVSDEQDGAGTPDGEVMDEPQAPAPEDAGSPTELGGDPVQDADDPWEDTTPVQPEDNGEGSGEQYPDDIGLYVPEASGDGGAGQPDGMTDAPADDPISDPLSGVDGDNPPVPDDSQGADPMASGEPAPEAASDVPPEGAGAVDETPAPEEPDGEGSNAEDQSPPGVSGDGSENPDPEQDQGVGEHLDLMA